MRRRNLLAGTGTTVIAGTGLAGPAQANPAEAADARVGTAAGGAQDAILATFDTYPTVGGLTPTPGAPRPGVARCARCPPRRGKPAG